MLKLWKYMMISKTPHWKLNYADNFAWDLSIKFL